MKKKNVLFWIFIALTITGLVAMAKDYAIIIDDLSSIKTGYLFKRNITGFLTLLIGICGIATSTFQKIKKNWTQRAIFWLGTIVAILTLVQSTFYPSSFQDYNKSAHKTEMAIRNIILLQNELQNVANPEEQTMLEDEIRSTIIDFYNSIEYDPIAMNFSLIPAAYAQTPFMSKPQWVESKCYGDGSDNLYFIGEASARRLLAAKRESRMNAKDLAVQFWQRQIGDMPEININKLAAHLASYGEFESGYFNVNTDSTFTYSSLFKIQHQVLKFATSFYEIEEKTQLSASLKEKIINIKLPKKD